MTVIECGLCGRAPAMRDNHGPSWFQLGGPPHSIPAFICPECADRYGRQPSDVFCKLDDLLNVPKEAPDGQ